MHTQTKTHQHKRAARVMRNATFFLYGFAGVVALAIVMQVARLAMA